MNENQNLLAIAPSPPQLPPPQKKPHPLISFGFSGFKASNDKESFWVIAVFSPLGTGYLKFPSEKRAGGFGRQNTDPGLVQQWNQKSCPDAQMVLEGHFSR